MSVFRFRKVGASISIVSAAVFTVAIAGCSGSSGKTSAAGGCLADIKSRGELRVGTVSNLPIDAIDTKTGQLTGFNADVLNAFVKDAGIAKGVKAEAMPFSSLIPAMQADKIDITSDTMFKTPEREKQITFTNTLMYNPEGLIVKKDNPKGLKQLDKFTDKASVGTYQGTVWVGWVTEIQSKQGSRAQVFPGANELIQAIGAGQVDAGLMSSAIASYMIKQNPSLGVQLEQSYEPRSRQGVATHLGVQQRCEDLKKKFDTWYAGYVKDGKMIATLNKWGVAPVETYLDGVEGYTKP